jgi:hypothetical protein
MLETKRAEAPKSILETSRDLAKPQGKAKPTSGLTKEQVDLGKELTKVSLTVVGQGPPPDIIADTRKVSAWKEARKQVWLDKKEVNGVAISPQLAQSLADYEAVLKPVAKELAKKVPKTNVPLVPLTEPPASFKTEAKGAMVPPFMDHDSIPDGPAWKAATSFYDRWAKGVAGVEFGKGDQIRESRALRDFSASLPTRATRVAELSSKSYYEFLGNGNEAKGRQLFVAQLNEVAFGAQTQRAQEERIGEKVFKVSAELANLVSMPDLAGKSLNTQQFEALAQIAQVKAVTGAVGEWSKTQQGSMYMEMIKNSVEFLKIPFQKIAEQAGEDKDKQARLVQALRGNPIYSGHMNMLEGFSSLMTGGVVKPNMVLVAGIFAKIFGTTQPGPGEFVPAGSQAAPQGGTTTPLDPESQKVLDEARRITGK